MSKTVSIILPPPNITGDLHLGHSFQQILMDILARYALLQGNKIKWIPGTDHAGIAGQIALQGYCRKHSLNPQDESARAEFSQVMCERITQQMKIFQLSVDWKQNQFTLNENFSLCVKKAFIRLYKDNLIYQGFKPVYFDKKEKTVISHSEVVHKEVAGTMWFIEYALESGEDTITVATTRPETLFGDVALAIHPNDFRYKHFRGKYARIPIIDRLIPIVLDERVVPEVGSGCIKVTPAHDLTDYAIAKRHGLELINIFDQDGNLNQHVPPQYRGLDTDKARAMIIQCLREQDYIVKSVRCFTTLPYGQRSDSRLEIITTPQWFLRLKPMVPSLTHLLQRENINFYPKSWKHQFMKWIQNLEDWCISRQIYWGHGIPAWYDKQGKVYIGLNEADVRSRYNIDREEVLNQEKDKLDTWFSSCLWPLAIQNWHLMPSQQFTHDYLITGFDILFFWILRMSLMTSYLSGQLPMKNLIITGLIRDKRGHKMSKSRGNVIDPLHLIGTPGVNEGWGIDAFRLAMATIYSPSSTVTFDTNKLKGSQYFCTKLSHAANYVHSVTQDHKYCPVNNVQENINIWIREYYNRFIQDIALHLKEARFDLLVTSAKSFIHDVFCNTYLPLVKVALKSFSQDRQDEVRNNLLEVFCAILAVIQPIIPTLSANLTNLLAPHQVRSRGMDPFICCEKHQVETVERILNLIQEARSLSPKTRLFIQCRPEERSELEKFKDFILYMVTDIQEIVFLQDISHLPLQAITSGGIKLGATKYLSLTKVSDLKRRRARLSNSLASESFLKKAPAEVIAKYKKELEQITCLLQNSKEEE